MHLSRTGLGTLESCKNFWKDLKMSESRGGLRKGAGRKPGIANKRTREIAEQAMLEGCTPLEVLLHLMREAFIQGDDEAAGKYAKDAAPYCHPRMQSISQNKNEKVEITFVNEFPDAVR